MSNDDQDAIRKAKEQLTGVSDIEKMLAESLDKKLAEALGMSDMTDLLNRMTTIPDFSMPTLEPPPLQAGMFPSGSFNNDMDEAEEFCQELAREADLLRSQVSEDKQVQLYVASPTGPVRVAALGYRNPNMLIFRGEKSEVVAHVQAAQVTLLVEDRNPEQHEQQKKDTMGFRYVGSINEQNR